jgi:hypothetical protein
VQKAVRKFSVSRSKFRELEGKVKTIARKLAKLPEKLKRALRP